MIFVRGARQLLTLRGQAPRRGIELSDLGIIPNGSVLIEGEKIDSVGSTRRIENTAAARSAKVIDVAGKVVLPGFVDSHTRLVFSSARLKEFEASSAAEPPAIESGRHAAVRTPSHSMRVASPKVLQLDAQRWIRLFAAHGTTTLEARSGQGLSLAPEIKALRVARRLDGDLLDVVATFRATWPESSDLVEDSAAIVGHITEVLLPLIRQGGIACFCDVECGPEAFSLAESARILEAASRLGFLLRVGANRTAHTKAISLALELKATSVEHLRFISVSEIDSLADSSTVATLLPGVIYHEGGSRYPPARKLIERSAAVALASGFGPDLSPTLSMPATLSLACTEMKLTPAEAIAAATINGAVAMDRAGSIGSLEPGKQADLVVFDTGDYREIPYYFGLNLCAMTIKRGKVIYPKSAMADSLSSL